MVVVPCPTPVTRPETLPIVATPVALLLQVPFEEVLLRVVVPPVHNRFVPVIMDGAELIVTVCEAGVPQPFA
jgi:ABC-type transport system involved in cytochrome c biogenesis permease component